jgi:GntR family transcriptional regulator
LAGQPSHVPRWAEAKNALLNRIERGDWTVGQRFPPEPELAAALGVSRATLREALRSLAEDGYLERRPGAGTTVANRAVVPNSLDKNIGLADIIRGMGMVPGTSSLQFLLAEATDEVAAELALDGQRTVAVIERVRTADGKPVVFSTHYYPAAANWDDGALLAGFDSESLYTLLENRAGVRIHYATATIQPAQADRALASRLDVPVGELLLHFRQVDFDMRGRPVILSSEFYRSGAFEFTIFRRGPH